MGIKAKKIMSISVLAIVLTGIALMLRIDNLWSDNSISVALELDTKYTPKDIVVDGETTTDAGTAENPYLIKNVENMINIQEYSKVNTCEGLYFEVDESVHSSGGSGGSGDAGDDDDDVQDEESGEVIEKETQYDLDLSVPEYLGIGLTHEYPFMGNIDFRNITVKTDTPIFYCIGEGADIKNLNIFGIIDSGKTNYIYNNIIEPGSNSTTQGTAGLALFVEPNMSKGKDVHISNINIIDRAKDSEQEKTLIAVDSNEYIAGIAGVIEPYNTQDSEAKVFLTNCNVKADIYSSGYGYVGGLIGHVNSGEGNTPYVELDNCKVSGYVGTYNGWAGGVIGFVDACAYINFATKLDLSQLEYLEGEDYAVEYLGYIVGASYEAIINKEVGCTIIKPADTWYELYPEIGTPDDDATSETYANLFHGLERLNGTNNKIEGEGTDEKPFIIDSDEDLATIAVVFCSAGTYLTEMFNNESFENIQKSTFHITKDLHMYKYNIYRLNNCSWCTSFSGKFIGISDNGVKPTIYMSEEGKSIDTAQGSVALWMYAANIDDEDTNILFKNFRVAGTVKCKNDMAGVLYSPVRMHDSDKEDTEKFNIRFEDIDSDVNLIKKYEANYGGSIGGIVATNSTYGPEGDEEADRGIVFEVIDCSYSGEIKIDDDNNSYYVDAGGIMGTLNPAENMVGNMTIDGYKYTGTITNKRDNVWTGATIGYVEEPEDLDYETDYEGYLTVGTYDIEYYKGLNKITIRNCQYGNPDIDSNLDGQIDTQGEVCNMDSVSSMGCILGREWLQVDLQMENVSVHNIDVNITNNSSIGGLCRDISGNVEINGLTYNEFNISNNRDIQGSTGMIMYEFESGLCNIDNYNINNCVVDAYRPHDIVAWNGGHDSFMYKAIVNVNGINPRNGLPYSSYNAYETRSDIRYKNGTNNMSMGCGAYITYNMFRKVEKAGDNSWTFNEIEDGYITGKGTVEDPIVIDTPEKMCIFSAMTNANFYNMALYFRYFEEYKDVWSNINNQEIIESADLEIIRDTIDDILLGKIVFASDLDMSPGEEYGYSYYPIQVYGGDYYGFDVDEYVVSSYNASGFTKEQAISNAIKVLDGQTVSGLSTDIVNNFKPIIKMEADKLHQLNLKNTPNQFLDYYGSENDYWAISGNVGRYASVFANLDYADWKVSNLHLEGRYYYLGVDGARYGGALLSLVNCNDEDYPWDSWSTWESTLDVSYIDIGTVHIDSIGTNEKSGTGLLIAGIDNDSVAKIDHIKILDGASVQADALIGYQTGANTKIMFSNIDLNTVLNNEVVDGVSSEPVAKSGHSKITIDSSEDVKSKYNGLNKALFLYHLENGTAIYEYDNYEDSNGIFTLEKNVTPVREKSYKKGDVTYPYKVNLELLENKDYVFRESNDRYLIVNMIYENITKGTGTKDDPFILENARQLMTMYYCLDSNGSNTPTEKWFVGNAPGGVVDYTSDDNMNDGSIGFIKHLMKAYYKLGDDINFMASSNTYSEQKAMDLYRGLGTYTYPFAGYIDGEDHTITMPNFGGEEIQKFGLFSYTEGIYVKDIKLKTADTGTIYAAGDAKVGVLSSYSKGGDSVIDNVTINANIETSECTGAIGGYFGVMEYGSLTLLGSENSGSLHSNLVNLSIRESDNGSVGTKYDYMNAVVGSVQSGAYIVFHGADGVDADEQYSYTYERDTDIVNGLRYTNKVAIINSDFIQSAGQMYIRKATASDEVKGGYYVEVEDEKQLYILGLAVGSGSLSVAALPHATDKWPYRTTTSTWKAESVWGYADGKWGENGMVAAAGTAASYPSIFQYFKEEDSLKATASSKVLNMKEYFTLNGEALETCIFNKSYMVPEVKKGSKYDSTTASANQYNVTYKLTKGEDGSEDPIYDMSTIEFHGIGATSSIYETDWSFVPYAFAANLIGITTDEDYTYTSKKGNVISTNNTTINLDIDTTGTNRDTAGFISVYASGEAAEKAKYLISHLNITGSVVGTKAAGGVIGSSHTVGEVHIQDVDLVDLDVKGTDLEEGTSHYYAGGMIGRYEGTGYRRYVLIRDCDISNITVNHGDVAGLVIGLTRDGVKIQDCNITGSTASCEYTGPGNQTKGYAGGVVGYNYAFGPSTGASDWYITRVKLSDCTIKGYTSTGGIIGRHSVDHNVLVSQAIYNVNLSAVNLEPLTQEAGTGCGKYIGSVMITSHNQKVGTLSCTYTEGEEEDMTRPTIGYCNSVNTSAVMDITASDYSELDITQSQKLQENMYRAVKSEGGEKLITTVATGDRGSDLLRWSSDIGSIVDNLNEVLGQLTENTGLINGGNIRGDTTSKINYNNCIGITIKSKEVDWNSGTVINSSKKTLEVTGAGTNARVFTTVGFNTGIVYSDYSEIKPNTFSVIEIKYYIDGKDIDGNPFQEIIEIPFYIDQTVNIDRYSRVASGRILNLDILKFGKQDVDNKYYVNEEIKVTDDNSYTMYAEFTYGKNRTVMDQLYLPKVFRANEEKDTPIPVGTRLTLVDITDNVYKTYYYEVKNQGVYEVPLVNFLDEDGVAYRERNIASEYDLKTNSKWTTFRYRNSSGELGRYNKNNYGVEQFFIYVDSSRATAASGTDIKKVPGIVIKENGQDTSGIQLFQIRRCATVMNSYAGQSIGFVEGAPSISFYNDSADEGHKEDTILKKDVKITLNASIENKASSFYWGTDGNVDNVNEDDYSNKDKYLEVAIYLENTSGQRALLPKGTKIKVDSMRKVGEGEPQVFIEGSYEGIQNTSNIFYFKDAKVPFALKDLTDNTITTLQAVLDFADADFSNTPSGKYHICFELLRVRNKEYPIGEESLQIIKTADFDAIEGAEYGFRLEREEGSNLAYNKSLDPASEATKRFNMLLNSTLEAYDGSVTSVEVRYKLLWKVKEGGKCVYKDYSGVSIGEDLDGDGTPDDAVTLKIDGSKAVYSGTISTVKVEQGVGLDPINVPLKDKIPLKTDIQNLSIPIELKFHTSKTEITNYKLVAEVYVNNIKESTDYIVYNVSNIALQ